MRIIIFLSLFVGVNILFSQDLLVKLDMLNSFASMGFNSTSIEKERDTKIAEISTKEKGEFETTTMYDQRLREAKLLVEEIKEKYNDRIKIERKKFDNRQNEIRVEIQQLLKYSQDTTTSRFTIGTYNADKEEFPIILATGGNYQINIPLSSARTFKESFSSKIANGTRQLTVYGDWEYFNWSVRYNDDIFPFGPNKDSIPELAMSKVTNLIPPKLSVEVVFSEPSGDDRLDAAETAELIITVSNKGKGSAFGLEIETLIDENSKINFSSISYIGEIPSGEKRSKRLKLNANADIETGESVITLKFKEQNGFAPNDQRIKFFTEAFIPPDLVIVDYGIEDFDMDARITPGETVMIIVRVQNLGAGTAEDVKAFVNRNSTNIFFYGNSQSSFSLDALNPGDYSDISFDIVSNRDAVDMPITISITESTGQFGVKDHPLNLQFNQVQKRVSEITISPKKVLTQMYDPSMGLSIDIENNIPIAKKQNKNALAVIFGIEQYKNVPGATFAKRDAAIVKNYFDTSLGIPQNRTYYQTNEDVTKAEFEKVFSKGGWLDKRLKEDSDVYVFYAGHGAPYVDNKEAYLIPYDGDPNYPTQTGFSLESLYENLGQLNARSVTVVLDACFTGANREEQALLANARPVYIKIKKPSARGLTVYSASGNQEISSAYPEKKHGLFTYFFLKGLQGDADRNNDNMISVDELGIFVANKVSEKAVEFDREQTPEMQSNDGSRILVKY